MIRITSGQYSAEALNNRKSRRSISYNGTYSQETDNANISSFGSLLARASAEFKNIPDIREDKVSALKEQIDSGSYNPPLDKLANILYMSGILDATEE
ncbi:MAG: flagellar biosynthesis anti-sigma factor FlgM [Synergistaceae bacterium]|nr:flagellar biosynthesis anti-sigma factor FlgM [Synergistaceae bacterium]